MEKLTSDECWRLMGTQDVGRFAVVAGGYPEVFPVNYAVVEGLVVLRTAPGLKLAHARFERVCVQVDELDRRHRTGWTVLVRGIVHEVRADDPRAEAITAAARRIEPWVSGAKDHMLAVTPLEVTGRRVVR